MIFDYRRDDWQTREDAETLQRSQVIMNDPERLAKAKACIKASVEEGKKVLKGTYTENRTPSRRNNPATIKKL